MIIILQLYYFLEIQLSVSMVKVKIVHNIIGSDKNTGNNKC